MPCEGGLLESGKIQKFPEKFAEQRSILRGQSMSSREPSGARNRS
jgi:hypothetical protein